MRIRKRIIFVLLGLLVFSHGLYCGEPAIIVTVDGLSFADTLIPGIDIEESDHYLKTALENMNIDLPGTAVVDFTWSRDAEDTDQTVAELREFLKEKYRRAQQENKRLIVVAHSWGTVLTYLALSSQSVQVPADERVYVDLYITLGSPLGTDNAHNDFNYPEETVVIDYTASRVSGYDFCDTCLPLAEQWFNYWAWGDVISGPLQGFIPFGEHPQWLDFQIDASSYVSGYPGRNTTTTVIWHKYDSLQPGGVVNNQPLLDEVKKRVEGDSPIVDNPPFGGFDTPLDGTVVRSSIAVTGWALDDMGVNSVKIYRQAGNSLVYIGDAVFVEGARPDIETAYPGYPHNRKAGWGYMMLTNFLPNEGNGTFHLTAIAEDSGGQQVTLGSKTIHCDNANAVKPFGAIDTPAQGSTASGSRFMNQGWALTPPPNSIPADGSTINVYVDGVYQGHLTYNIYRPDIADLFPGYANKDGAAGYFYLDTTPYANGVHTIYWTAMDDAGNIDGIGSRYFTIQNTGGNAMSRTQSAKRKEQGERWQFSRMPADYPASVRIKKGCNNNMAPKTLYPDENGIIHIRIKELERLEVHFPCSTLNISPLPVGSTLDIKQGVFSWGPGPGFIGVYRLVFTGMLKDRLQVLNIKILPKYE